MAERCLSLVLAAGEGMRMRSSCPKILHNIGGLPLVVHVIRSLTVAGGVDLAVVIGAQGARIKAEIEKFAPNAQFFEQKQRLGTAHAVLSAKKALREAYDEILIAYGDAPLIRPQIIAAARRKLAQGADLVVSGFYMDKPEGYGRLVEKAGKLQKIVEEKEATSSEKEIKLCNGGFMAFKAASILPLLSLIKNENAKGEYYLTDIVEIAAARGFNLHILEMTAEDALGVNTQKELAAAAAIWQNRKRDEMMEAGVMLVAPETVYFAYDTDIAADVIIEPNVYFGTGVKIASGAHIRAFSYIEGADIGRNSVIGPYARLRPDSKLAQNVKIGNFCEIKKVNIAEGAKINHLTYMGDAEIGAGSNIGAGVISCNYDGYNKHKLKIGAGAFIGSNSALIAPLTIGDRAYIASGSVITDNVAEDSLAFGRARQVEKPEGGKRLRALFSMKKNEKKKRKSVS